MEDRKPRSEQNRERQNGFRQAKVSDKGAFYLPTYLVSVQNISYKKIGLDPEEGLKIGGRNISHLRYADDTILLAENSNDLKQHPMKAKEESAKAGLQLNVKETKSVSTEETYNFTIDNEDNKI